MTPELEEQTSQAGLRILKTRLRRFLYERLLEKEPEHIWEAMLLMELDFEGPAETEWRYVTSLWKDRSQPQVRKHLEGILRDAQVQAVADTSLIFSESLTVVRSLIAQYQRDKISSVISALLDVPVSIPS